ncbi:MAG: hypothetical protein ACK56F_16695, partial [bacterium]
ALPVEVTPGPVKDLRGVAVGGEGRKVECQESTTPRNLLRDKSHPFFGGQKRGLFKQVAIPSVRDDENRIGPFERGCLLRPAVEEELCHHAVPHVRVVEHDLD